MMFLSLRPARLLFSLFCLMAYLSLAFFAGTSAAAPAPTRSVTGQALALRALLHAMVPPAAKPKTFAQMGFPTDLRRAPDGRFVYDRANLMRSGALASSGGRLSPRLGTVTPQVNEAVQTYDVFNPPPTFSAGNLTPTNLTPVWTADETTLIFSSNRTATGGLDTRFHLWAISVAGGTAIQLTSSAGQVGGGEFFPAISAGNNAQLAFTSDANSPGVQNLYSIALTAQTTTVTSLPSATIRTDPLGRGGLGFSGVGRPTFSPTNSDEIAFSAVSTTGTYAGRTHLYFLYVSTGGYSPTNVSLPAKITDGPADDTDPAWSQDGQLIAFSSTASALAPTNLAAGPDPNTSLIATSAPNTANRSIYLIGGGGRFGFGTVTNSGKPITLVGADNFGPAWSSLRRNPYTNPAPGSEYIAFSRGASPASPHDIFYLQVLANTDAGGESRRSNEAATTPLPAQTPVFQVNSGGPDIVDPNFPAASYVAETHTFNGISPIQVVGGTATAAPAVPLVVNTTNDPGTPPAIYQTDRNGTFTYTLRNLTPFASYRVRLHLSDPKDTAAGQRVFKVNANGAPTTIVTPTGASTNTIDIVGQAQSSPGRLTGLVSNRADGTAIAGATLTLTDYVTGARATTTPSPLTSTANTVPAPGGGAPVNYSGTVGQGTYLVTLTPPAGSGFLPVSQVIRVGSGAITRLDFPIVNGTSTAKITVSDSNMTGVAGATFTVFDTTSGLMVVLPTGLATDTSGVATLTLPPSTYSVNVTPPSRTFATQIVPLTTTAANTPDAPATAAVTLPSGSAIGQVGGLVSTSVGALPIPGALVRVIGANNTLVAILRTTPTTTSPAAPNGDGLAQNYSASLPVGTYTLQFSASGFAPLTQQVTVVNTPANGATPAKIFTRADQVLVSTSPIAGQNTAVVDEFTVVVPGPGQFGNVPTYSGTITLDFVPVSGDPPIVQGVEVQSSRTPSVSSGFGDLIPFPGGFTGSSSSPPQILNAIGGVIGGTNGVAAQPQIAVTFVNPGIGVPSAFNVYRSPGAGTSTNNPPANGSGTEGSTPYVNGLPVTPLTDGAGNPVTDIFGRPLFQFIDTGVASGSQYYYQLTALYQQILTPEAPPTPSTDAMPISKPGNPAVQLNTDDNAGETSPTGNLYDDIYPTWSPFLSVFSIAYSSNRTVTYNNPVSAAASETAVSVGQSGRLSATATVGSRYAGLLISQVVNLDPPTLLPFSGNEIIHVTDSGGNITRTGITPGQPVTFTVRLSSREAGVDDNAVFLQIKDPDSKYQDADGLEHKVFAKDFQYLFQANNPYTGSGLLQNSGSASLLMNGGSSHSGYNKFAVDGGRLDLSQRGSVGGIDGAESFVNNLANTSQSDSISVGRDGEGTNTEPVVDGDGKPVMIGDTVKVPASVPGGNPNLFIPWGPEFECQVVNPAFATSGNPKAPANASAADYRDPYYLAGIDDQLPFSGFKPFVFRPTDNYTDRAGNPRPAEWLAMTRLPGAQQDGQGGVLYSVTWRTPTSGSDFYLDVIAFDKAVAPVAYTASGGGGSNWRIYDNVWGFSTAASISINDILVVSDYALGQKFGASTFGGQRGLLNLVPKLYGAESYVTDIDVNLLPNATYRYVVIAGANKNRPNTEVSRLATYYNPDGTVPGGLLSPTDVEFNVRNGLGVGSYFDRFIDDGGRVDELPSVRSQNYSLWRILARGPVPTSVYNSYLPSFQTQPAVNDTAAPKKTTFAAGRVAVANRCILWLSPYTGDLLVGPGTLTDQATQASLRAFVASGGRLCISGQDVGSALTQGGTTNNAAGGFLSDVLNATLATSGAGTHTPVATATGGNPAENRISYTPYFDGTLLGNYPELNDGGTVSTVAPGQRLIRVSNNYGGNIFERNYILDPVILGNWRTDGSLDQLGPYIAPFPEQSNNFNSVLGQIDTITPGKTAHTDLNLAPFTNTIPPIDNGNVGAASSPGGVGLIYTENPLTATGGTGSKVVYSTFGLEALSTEYYKRTSVFKPNPVIYMPRNQRQNILHNIVNYLRTGSIAGTVRSTSGNGVAGSGVGGVTVYALPAYAAAIPGRGTFSAVTDSNGNFRLDGMEPGNYTLAAYRTGYLRTTSNAGVVFTVEGDTLQQASLNINPASPGSVSGTVKDTSGNPVSGADVSFTSADGLTFPTTTDSNGAYTLATIPPGTYTGTATKAGFGSATQPVTITSSTAVTVNFVLTAGPGAVTGRVVDTAGNPVPNATVFFSGGSPATIVASPKTDATGTYSQASIPAGSYTLTATAAGFGNSAPVSISVTGGNTTTPPDLVLGAAASGTLGGLISSSSGTDPLGGATVTITNSGTGQVITAASTAPATIGPDGGQINYGPVTLPTGTYTVSVTRAGLTTPSQTVTVAGTGFIRLDFTGVNGLPALHLFPAGLSFLSLPADYSSLGFDGLFGALNTAPAGSTPNGNRSHIAVWNPLTGAYALDPDAPADSLRLGVGYWVFLKSSVSLNQAGGAAPASVRVALNPVWNQIGVPSTKPIPVASLRFDMGSNTTLSFADAISARQHVVSPILYRYNGSAYQAVTASDSLQPYEAYWIQVFVPTTVVIPGGN